jgi:hypothetical protein
MISRASSNDERSLGREFQYMEPTIFWRSHRERTCMEKTALDAICYLNGYRVVVYKTHCTAVLDLDSHPCCHSGKARNPFIENYQGLYTDATEQMVVKVLMTLTVINFLTISCSKLLTVCFSRR